MELYRLEVNPKEIGVEVDTLTRNNIRRSPHYQRLYNIMEEIAEYSIQRGNHIQNKDNLKRKIDKLFM